MCESCHGGVDRRSFLVSSGALGAAALMSGRTIAADDAPAALPYRDKPAAKVAVVFLYPPADVVYAGKNEDNWRVHNWFTWPGNQFQPEQQQAKFIRKIKEITEPLGIQVVIHPNGLYQKEKIKQYIEQTKSGGYDAVLVVNFWNTFAGHSFDIATQAAPASIVYQPVGSNHQLPSEPLRKTPGLFYIHSIENWAEIERGLRAVRAAKMMACSRLLRVSGRTDKVVETNEPTLGTHVVTVPAEQYNGLFDSIELDEDMKLMARQIKQRATEVRDVTDKYLMDAARAHRTVDRIMKHYGADAITIECLFLKDRKPCISFAVNNGNLTVCGCENHLEGTLTQMLGRWLWDRAGFMHNPEFDTSENHYFGSHCTCAWKLHGADGPSQPYLIRPFFHQLPKTPALDVQWPQDEPVIVAKYHAKEKSLSCWTGRVISSPTCPPAGGCATRVLVDVDRVDDICDIYGGPHPILFCGDRGDARTLKAFAHMYHLQCEGNV